MDVLNQIMYINIDHVVLHALIPKALHQYYIYIHTHVLDITKMYYSIHAHIHTNTHTHTHIHTHACIPYAHRES